LRSASGDSAGATRSENGAVRTSVIWAKDPEDERWEGHFLRKINVLSEAENQVRESGSIAQQTYAELGFTEKEVAGATTPEIRQRVAIADQGIFLGEIANRKEHLQRMFDAYARVAGRRHSDELAYSSLPPIDDMDRIIRYEERIYRQLDWALERLSVKQEMRKNRTSTSTSDSGQITKRSQ
jgi:hypothetical protein